MAILNILRFPDPRLRKKCLPIKEVTADLKKLADDMLETMYSAHGLGLSAIQVDCFVRLLVADTRPPEAGKNGNERYKELNIGELEQKIKQPVVLFNPEITDRKGETIFQEGCLSFPSYYADVRRSAVVEVQGLNVSGQLVKIKTDGVLAVCIQHEIDHLDGKLFIDHLSPVKAERLRAQIKKYGYPDDPSQSTNDNANESKTSQRSLS